MDQMRKLLEQINAEMERQKEAQAGAGQPSAVATADCPKCGRPNPIEAFDCAKCGQELRKKKQRPQKKQQKNAPTTERQATVKPSPAPAIKTSAAPESTSVVRTALVVTPQTMRQGLIYQLLIGPPRGLQDDF